MDRAGVPCSFVFSFPKGIATQELPGEETPLEEGGPSLRGSGKNGMESSESLDLGERLRVYFRNGVLMAMIAFLGR